jgi:hypothetical protein
MVYPYCAVPADYHVHMAGQFSAQADGYLSSKISVTQRFPSLTTTRSSPYTVKHVHTCQCPLMTGWRNLQHVMYSEEEIYYKGKSDDDCDNNEKAYPLLVYTYI